MKLKEQKKAIEAAGGKIQRSKRDLLNLAAKTSTLGAIGLR